MKHLYIAILFFLTLDLAFSQEYSSDIPLIETLWGQRDEFARFSPDNQRLGCWSTAIAQMLYYHRLKPTGRVYYKCSLGYIINENLDSHQFDWDLFVNEIGPRTSENSINEVALYSCFTSVAIQKDFGTGTYVLSHNDRAGAIASCFNCLSKIYKNSSYSINDIKAIIIRERDAQRPVMLHLRDLGRSKYHAVVIDAYRIDQGTLSVHINMGWKGKDNGWYDFNKSILDYDDHTYRRILTITTVPDLIYSGGRGTENDPYQIATAQDLIDLGQNTDYYGKFFILTADIDLSDFLFRRAVIAPDVNDIEEGFQGADFTGHFDGREHVIRHLTIQGHEYLALFGQLSAEAEVSNLRLEGVEINGTGYYIGGLAGINYGTVSRSYCTGTVQGDDRIGGLVGRNSGSVSSSYSSVRVHGVDRIGGLVGYNYKGDITSCYSIATVSGDDRIGGLVGYHSSGASASLSYSIGTISGDDSIGGLVGENNESSISLSYSNAAVSGDDKIGGLVGNNSGNISNSYSSSMVRGDDDIGGLVGKTDDSTGRVSNMDCFWDTQNSNQTTSAGGSGRTTAQMYNINTYLNAGWDFVNETANGMGDIWKMPLTIGYPLLTWQGDDTPVPIIDDFETHDFSNFNYQHDGDADWSITSKASFSGQFSARSGDIVHDESSTLKLTHECHAGQISFQIKVSSEASCDELIFFIDGYQWESWSGEKEWTLVSFLIPEGWHTFEWSYQKDSSGSTGEDTAWIDNILISNQ